MFTDNENGSIIKIDAKTSFLDIREAFLFNGKVVGKILMQFRSYNPEKQKGEKITQRVDFYMDLEEAAYFAELLKTGRMKSLCKEARMQAESQGKSTAYAFGYTKFGGTAKTKTSRQLKLQLSDDGRLWIKAMEGPGTIEDKGQIKPAYKDNEASDKVSMVLSEEQSKKIGLAIERAIHYFDNWNAFGVVKEKVARFHQKPGETTDPTEGFFPDYIPNYDTPEYYGY